MTFTEIVQKVMNRTNLTSAEAQTRIGDEVNEVYRELVSSMGMETSIRSTVSATSSLNSRYVTFGGGGTDVIKLLSVFLPNSVAPPPYNVLTSATFDELRNTITSTTWPPTRYAISKMGAKTVEIFLDVTAPAAGETLSADCLLASATLAGTDQPVFPENFHDILVQGVLAIELDKMDKSGRAKQAQDKFEKRSGDLRMFIAKDAYLAIHQAKTLQGWIGTQLIPS